MRGLDRDAYRREYRLNCSVCNGVYHVCTTDIPERVQDKAKYAAEPDGTCAWPIR
jgi:hypothetical protein